MSRYRLFIGNPGAGKSTLANCIINKALFKSGISFGFGKTNQLCQIEIDDITYLDTPGLADIKMRQTAAAAITKALKLNGKYQIFFVVTLSAGRLRPEDLTTIWLVLLSTRDITIINIIINKLSKEEQNSLKSISALLNSCLLAPLKEMGRNIQHNLLPLPHNLTLEDADDTIVEFPGLNNFVEKVKWIPVSSDNIRDIPGDEDSFKEQLDSLSKKINNLSANQVPILLDFFHFFIVYFFR